MKRWIAGAFAGCVATGPMSLAMLVLRRALPGDEQYALPPRQITRRLTQRASQLVSLPQPTTSQQHALTVLGHFAYGALTGGLYPLLSARLRLAPPLKGAAFGLLVWLGSYFGWIPVSGLLQSARHFPARRNALMIVAHIVWGVMLGLMEASLADDKSETQDGA
jgi:putative membrane protein